MAPRIETTVTYEDLAAVEHHLDDVDGQILRHEYLLQKPILDRRSELVANIPNFWPLVFEGAPSAIEEEIEPSDSHVFADALVDFSVDRFDVDNEPKSYSLKFTFKANEWFDDEVLEKKFHYRTNCSGARYHVSEPVEIHWKPGKDLTGGLLDSATALFDARQRRSLFSTTTIKSQADMDEKVEMKNKVMQLAEYEALIHKLEFSDPGYRSFFLLFGFVSHYRYVTAEEHAGALAEHKKAQDQQENPIWALEAERDLDEQEIEICDGGEELGYKLANDLWPHAIKYFTAAQENDTDDDDDTEDDSESSAMDEDDDSDEEEGKKVDIRSLVQGKRKKSESLHQNGDGSPAKARKMNGK
ncbi:hypothetical protein K402DRAFT_410029 [Aulographum hederae CBS 113979]|uniref:NAP family protein n=1 Tax=Aulographum hederae CBS 113979 TaxID=1176131 RepID=A0A6G1HDD0_9PEZI|nr:hypothetical protein K402DRAFT_410029 [Aulographum hederae CBS 113979]